MNEGLVEGYRLAADARATLISRKQDATALVGLGGLFLWVILIGMFVGLSSTLFNNWAEAALAATIAAIAITVPSVIYVRRAYDARIDEQVRWMERLRPGMVDQASSEGSAFDLLADVTRQVPAWLSIRRRNALNRHPFLSTAAFIGLFSSTYIALVLLSSFGSAAAPYLVVILGAFTLLSIASIYWMVATDRKESQEMLRTWEHRLEASQKAMEDTLGGL